MFDVKVNVFSLTIFAWRLGWWISIGMPNLSKKKKNQIVDGWPNEIVRSQEEIGLPGTYKYLGISSFSSKCFGPWSIC